MSEQQISKTCSNLNVYYISGVLFTKQNDLFDLLFKVSVNPIIDHFSKNNFFAPSDRSYLRLEIVDSNLNMSAKKRKSSCPFARKKKTSEEPQRKFGKKSFRIGSCISCQRQKCLLVQCFHRTRNFQALLPWRFRCSKRYKH